MAPETNWFYNVRHALENNIDFSRRGRLLHQQCGVFMRQVRFASQKRPDMGTGALGF
jgi:hypothetical protein